MKVLLKRNWGTGDAQSFAYSNLNTARTAQRQFREPLPALAYDAEDGAGWRTGAGTPLAECGRIVHDGDVHEVEWQRLAK